MENNEDIKIVEEKIKALNLHIDNYYKNDCETSVCKELVKERNALENLLSRLKTAERMNDVLAEYIVINETNIAEKFCVNKTENQCKLRYELYNCDYCIKEWARKKVEENV